METASHNVASLKVSAAAAATENEQPQQEDEAPKREVDQSRTAAVVHTKAATVTFTATNNHLKSPPSSDPSASATTKATSMGEATSLKRSAGAALEEGAVLDSSSGKRPAKHKHLKTGRKKKSSAHKKQGATAGRWTPTEHADFLKGLALYGREWKRVAADIPTRSASQVRLCGGSRQQQTDLVWFVSAATN